MSCADHGHEMGDPGQGDWRRRSGPSPDPMNVLKVGGKAQIRTTRTEGCSGRGAYYTYLRMEWFPRLPAEEGAKDLLRESIIGLN